MILRLQLGFVFLNTQTNLLFLNAKPELDFKYISNASAFSFVINAAYQTRTKGALLDVYVTSLRLCFARRFCKSDVDPI